MATTITKRFPAGKNSYQRVDLTPLEKFHFSGIVHRVSERSIKISKGRSKSHFWVENRLDPSIEFNVGDACDFTVAIRTYTGTDLSIKTKLYLVDLKQSTPEQVDISDNPVFTMECKALSCLQVGDREGSRQFIMELVRLDEANIEQEVYKMRYYTETPEDRFTTGKCTVEFTFINSAKIILENGDEYYEKKSRKVVENGVETVSYSSVYVPCLSITRIWPTDE